MSGLPVRAVIDGAGAICSVGYSLPQVWASVRVPMGGFSSPGPVDRWLQPIRMAVVDEGDLEPLLPENEALALVNRERRMIRLLAPALREAMAGLELRAPPLFLGLPRPLKQAFPTAPAILLAAMARQAGLAIDEQSSRAFACGRAAFFSALGQGLHFLASGRAPCVLVGAVDTHLDLRVLAELDSEERLLGEHVSDGFVPGEGAGALVLARPHGNSRPAPFVAGVGLASDPGHRYSRAPALGEGLWQAMNALFAATPLAGRQIQATLAGFNGESFGGKEWGVARMRHGGSFAAAASLDHPADCYGDVGAASGAILTALAHAALIRGQHRGPVLVWASSDHEERGCAIVDSDRT